MSTGAAKERGNLLGSRREIIKMGVKGRRLQQRSQVFKRQIKGPERMSGGGKKKKESLKD